jgi:hypothetical protein
VCQVGRRDGAAGHFAAVVVDGVTAVHGRSITGATRRVDDCHVIRARPVAHASDATPVLQW